MTSIYVGNLPFSVSEEQLKEMFAAHGTVNEVRMVVDRQTGRSRGFGFVEMANEDEATAAIEAMNEFDIEDRKLTVSRARARR